MNASEKRAMSHFPSGLDAIVNERFPGADCSTRFCIIEMRHVTTWNAKLPMATKRKITEFVAGFMSGNYELSQRLKTLKQAK